MFSLEYGHLNQMLYFQLVELFLHHPMQSGPFPKGLPGKRSLPFCHLYMIPLILYTEVISLFFALYFLHFFFQNKPVYSYFWYNFSLLYMKRWYTVDTLLHGFLKIYYPLKFREILSVQLYSTPLYEQHTPNHLGSPNILLLQIMVPLRT